MEWKNTGGKGSHLPNIGTFTPFRKTYLYDEGRLFMEVSPLFTLIKNRLRRHRLVRQKFNN